MADTKPHNISLKVLKCPNSTEAGGHSAVSSWLKVTVAQKERIDLVAGQNDLIAMGARKALKEGAGLGFSGLRFIGIDGLPKTGQAWTRVGTLAATVIVPPNTSPALRMLVKATTEKWNPPEQTLVAPLSFPELNALGPASDDGGDGWKY